MDIAGLGDWPVDVAQAIKTQVKLASMISTTGSMLDPQYIAGVDVSVNRAEKSGRSAVVVLSYPRLELVEVKVAEGDIAFPYVPGLLSFREIPLLLTAFAKLSVNPDLILVDGQGMAHPRRIGLASHLGLLLDKPAIGCAKSRLCGHHEMPGDEPGSHAELIDNGEIIGVVLRTRPGVKPLYISIGHKINLEDAIRWVMASCRGYRLPEPTRLAHLAAGGKLKEFKKEIVC